MEIYTDGSYNKKDNTCGYAAILVNSDKPKDSIVIYGQEIRPDYIAMWNVGAEIAAVENAIIYCSNNNITDVTICHDYIGISNWVNGTWKTNKSVTQVYKLNMNMYKRNMRIKFKHIKAHTGQEYNELADACANQGRCIESSASPVICKLSEINTV